MSGTRATAGGWPAHAVLAAACGLCVPAQAEPTSGFVPLVVLQGDAPALGPGWRVATLPKQKPAVTRYSAERLAGRPALRIDARQSYGNLVLALAGAPPRELRWAWRVDQPNTDIDLRKKAADDSPVKVCLSFDLALESVPFFERELLRLARSRSSEPLPAATLCWVWAQAEAAGTVLRNAYTGRVRYIVLRGAGDAVGRWLEEKRDVRADFRRAFGDEVGEGDTLPPVTAVIVAGDADNTGGRSLAFVADLLLVP